MAKGKKKSGARGIGIVERIAACELRGHNSGGGITGSSLAKQQTSPQRTLRTSREERRENRSTGQIQLLTTYLPFSSLRLFCRLVAGGRLVFQTVDGFFGVGGLRTVGKDLQVALEFLNRFGGAIQFLKAD